jgi:2-phospho-L-lactate/phosphoenolpyruvate guanylyltransferase
MSIWAIVPVKPLRRGKSRLASALDSDERFQLNRALLEHTVRTLLELKELEQVLVVSRDSSAIALARDLGARTVQEDGAPSLNTALRRATATARAYDLQAILVVPADLPLLGPDDVRALLSRAVDPPVVVLAPDRRRRGTNAILLSPPDIIDFDFGGRSFDRHSERARRAGARLEIVELPALSLDLDLPEDLELIRRMEASDSKHTGRQVTAAPARVLSHR